MERIPSDLQKALAGNAKAKAIWKDITPVARRDFVRWIESAKQPETRKRRVEVACDKLVSGKRRPCCYAVVPMNLYRNLSADPKAQAKWKSLTPMERRDLVAWIDAAKEPMARIQRIDKASALLAAGKRPTSLRSTR